MNNNTETLNEFIDRFLRDTKDILSSYKGLIISNLSLTNFRRNIDRIYNGRYYIDAFSNRYNVKLLLPKLVAYIGVFGQECRSSTGHFCNEIF
ncbi:hypothetical protein L5F64_00360 [Aliarcobacter butzleri]|uniref:hypothetical protein n=1 Tax=Aliarcobacter butzleri TaxID=28197 RepID=UPI001EDAAF85|nr:hypothetical protein [Aliarcobacter butzleri]MCG3710272.1 hypothetical protein [Aliarcobacter butzleri]MCG3714012.1 hypothetical protein [Aliarcobacter butzleri]